jgi:feruloyl esterase
MKRTGLGVLVLVAALCGCSPKEARQPPVACFPHVGQTIGGALIEEASIVPAPGAPQAYCKVMGRIGSQLHFQVNLPVQWDGARLVQYGGGGYDGVVRLSPDPQAGNAVSVASNGGHTSKAGNPGTDASFALNDELAREDFGHASSHKTLKAAREIVLRHYGHAARKHYFSGCSNGGREALMQATRYPDDYDGIVSLAPAVSFTELMQAFARNSKALAVPGAPVPREKARLLAKAAVQACDAQDGIEDGLVSRPNACSFDPGSLRCTGKDRANCLTDAQVDFARTIYSETRDVSGRAVYPGWEPGGEDIGWPDWVTAPPRWPLADQHNLANGFAKYFLAGDAKFDFLKSGKDLADLFPPAFASARRTLDATPDLGAFFARGGKLVLAHGMHDWAISYKASVRYFDEVGATVGPAARDAGMEFFLLPGVQHCGEGVGADEVDLFGAVAQWVEAGARPSAQDLEARKSDRRGVLLTRPVCAYPSFPRYKGSGDPALASSFTCSVS